MTCEDCDTTEDVSLYLCPLAKELESEEVEVWLCSNCYDFRCQSI